MKFVLALLVVFPAYTLPTLDPDDTCAGEDCMHDDACFLQSRRLVGHDVKKVNPSIAATVVRSQLHVAHCDEGDLPCTSSSHQYMAKTFTGSANADAGQAMAEQREDVRKPNAELGSLPSSLYQVHLKHTSPPNGEKLIKSEVGLAEQGRFAVLCISAIVLLGIVCILTPVAFHKRPLLPRSLSCEDGNFELEAQNDASCSKSVQLLFLTWVSLQMTHSMIVIPESYNLAQDVGRGAASSGWLIGAAWPLASVGVPISFWATKAPWNQVLNRYIILVCAFIYATSAFLYAVAADPMASWDWTPERRFALLIMSRLMQGFSFGAAEPCLRMMAQHVSLPSELVPLNVCFTFTVSIGIGMGPFLSSAVAWVFSLQDIRARSSMPLYVMFLAWMLLLLLCWLLLPLEIEAPCQNISPCQSVSPELEKVSNARKKIWIHAAMLCVERAFLVSALEAATSFILEIEFGFSQQDIGVCIGCTFLLGVPCISLILKLKDKMSHGVLLVILLSICTLATMLLVDFSSLHVSYVLVLLADSIIFPTAYVGSGIAEGAAVLNAIPGSWYSQECLAGLRCLTIGLVGRFLAPPCARTIIQNGGRNFYAAAQTGLALVSVVGGWQMYTHMQEIDKARLGED